MTAILNAILFFEESSKSIFEDFKYAILDILLHLFWKIRLVNTNFHVVRNTLGLFIELVMY